MRSDVRRFALLAGLDLVDGDPVIPWYRSAEVVGIQFPADYRQFIDCFGSGEVRGSLGINTPLSTSRASGGIDGFSSMVDFTTKDIGLEFKAMRDELFDICPYPIYPEPGGLLAWAGSYNGDICFWLTEGDDPDRWPVMVWLRGEFPDAWRRYELGMVEFLLLALSGKDAALNDLVFSNSESRIRVPNVKDS